jgi:hypothetical protein
MSPLTGSYFWMWALYDLRIGTSNDTLSSCQIAANDIIQLDENQLSVLKKLDRSRMGIYEHLGKDGPYIRFKELITDKQFLCHCTSGYVGKKGELWYVRVVPPLDSDLGDYWITMTTPYVLIDFGKSDWIAFLKRTTLHCDGSSDQARLRKLLKYGLDTHYWNEFVFKAYHHHQQDAVFLTGILDMEATLPHA